MKLIKWKGLKTTKEMHRHDYRWIEDKKERDEWVREHWEVEEGAKK